MHKVIYIVGNDGAGKSTYSERLTNQLERAGLRVFCRHYYSSSIRTLVRSFLAPLSDASGRKGIGQSTYGEEGQGTRVWRRSLKKHTLSIFIWIYQFCMACEAWCRQLIVHADIVVNDRSFVDDLIGISEVLSLEIPPSLVRMSARMFPIREIVYVYAGHDIEYSSIVDNDLTKELHRRKGEQYANFLQILELSGVRVKTVYTGRHPYLPPHESGIVK